MHIKMPSEVMDFLEFKDSTRSIATITFKASTIVISLDGVQIIEVWDDARFKTKFDFTLRFVKASMQDINF